MHFSVSQPQKLHIITGLFSQWNYRWKRQKFHKIRDEIYLLPFGKITSQ